MTDGLQNRPKLVKAAFVEYRSESFDSVPNIIQFQYNPSELSRDITLPEDEQGGRSRERGGAAQIPKESITLTIMLDATDKLEQGDTTAVTKGIYPALSELELLMYHQNRLRFDTDTTPRSSRVERGGRGSAQKTPVVLLVWGLYRLLPIRIQSMSIRETAFDSMLNPIRAEVTMKLDVLMPKEFGKKGIARWAYNWTQEQKEIIAKLNP